MKFIPLPDFDVVASALNFETPDCKVSGGCDLYTTKAAGSDKKLYKNIDKSLESQHAALLKLGASLSPPQREELAASYNLSRSSPFGNLAEISSRRTFAYLIATLNASHPDYDFSHVLRPADFRRERNLRRVMSTIDSTLNNVRPSSLADGSLGLSSASLGSSSAASASTSPLWGPQMWALVNTEMRLQDCTVFSYHPTDNPFDEEDGAIWAMHYFFFSKALKRVAYLYLRGVPVMAHSPQLNPRQQHRLLAHSSLAMATRLAHRRGSRTSSGRIALSARNSGSGSSNLLSTSATKRPGLAIQDSDSSSGANKRARYWLGDRYADRVISHGDDDNNNDNDDDDDMEDVLLWSRNDDSDDDNYLRGDGGFMDNDDDDDDDVDSFCMEEEEEYDDDLGSIDNKGHVRAMSEEIAARMDLE